MSWLLAESSKRLSPLLSIILLFLSLGAQGLSISFCSNQNTGSGSSPTYNHFQSNGACQDTCQSSFAYAVLQGNNCWCSDYAPGDQTDNGSCNEQCPGFPTDQCGNQGQGLFGYYQLGQVQPSGTIGASPSASPSASPTPSSAPSSSQQAAQSSPPSSSTSPAPTSAAPSTTPVPSSPPTATPTPSTVVTTLLGSIRTVVITPTVPTAPAQTQVTTVSAATPDNFWNDTGKVAGTFTAVAVVAVVLIGALAWFFIRRHRSHESLAIRSTSDGDNHSASNVPFGVERRASKLTLATAGLGGVRRGDSNEKHTAENTPASMSRRASIPLTYDQRLDPDALFNLRSGANGSHASFTGSLRDDRDYSRSVLHVRNPDLTDEAFRKSVDSR